MEKIETSRADDAEKEMGELEKSFLGIVGYKKYLSLEEVKKGHFTFFGDKLYRVMVRYTRYRVFEVI